MVAVVIVVFTVVDDARLMVLSPQTIVEQPAMGVVHRIPVLTERRFVHENVEVYFLNV